MFTSEKISLMKAIEISEANSPLNPKKEIYPQVIIANNIFVHSGVKFLPEFEKLAKNYYGITPKVVNFHNKSKSAKTIINEWVSKKTNGKIKDLQQNDFEPNTKSVLVNVIYFKGEWAQDFNEAKLQEFHHLTGPSIKVHMMERRGRYRLDKDTMVSDAKVLEIPFANYEFIMLIVLPNEEGKEALDAVEKATMSNLGKLSFPHAGRKEMEDCSNEVHVKLPRFSIHSRHNLVDPLKDLGLNTMFDRQNADFSNMVKDNDIFVSKVFQCAFLKVSEKGVEAAAGSAVEYRSKGLPPQCEDEFICNRPFLMMIKHLEHQATLFYARVETPDEIKVNL